MDSIHDILTAAGITVLDARVAPRPGLFNPIGVLLHHTANPQHGDLPSLHLLQHGRADLAGPLVQLGAGREGTIASVTDGRANHAGRGSDVVAARVRADLEPATPGSDNTDGNNLFIGIEIENAGDGHDPYPQRQLDHVVDTCVALCVHFGWSANRVIGHKEWTHRKPDPTLNMAMMRKSIADAMIPPHPEPNMEELLMKDFFIIYYGDAPGSGDDTPARWAWWPSNDGPGRKTYISGDAAPKFLTAKGYSGELLLQKSEVGAIPNLAGQLGT